MSNDQQLISDSINRLFEKEVNRNVLESFEKGQHPESLWQLIEEGGYHRVLDVESGATWSDVQPILRAIGYYRVPLPLAETLLANWIASRAGLSECDGPATIIDGGTLEARTQAGTFVLSGTANRVPWGRQAQRFVILCKIDGRWIACTVGAGNKGIASIVPGANVASEPRDTIRFDQCRCDEHAHVDLLDEDPVRTYGALVRAVAMTGAAESVLAQALQHANERIQFGRPIGKFQAIQHMLAEVATDVAAALAAVSGACDAAGGRNAWIEVATAKVMAGGAAIRAARVTHQVHGAMGFTHEHMLHYGTRRIWSWRNEYGSDASWAGLVGAASIRRGGSAFWPDVTEQVARLQWQRNPIEQET